MEASDPSGQVDLARQMAIAKRDPDLLHAGQALAADLEQDLARDAAQLPLDDPIVTQFVFRHTDPAVPCRSPGTQNGASLRARAFREPDSNSVGGILLPGAPRTAF